MRKSNVTQWEIAVLGAGTMGQCIAQLFATNGHTVRLYNRTPANLEKALVQIRANLDTLVGMGEVTAAEIPAIMERIHGTSDLKEAVTAADYVIENVAEVESVKKMIFAQLDEYCPADTIIASDTSTMNIYEFIEISHPERLIISHFFNPAHVMPLVELVRGPKTSDETVQAVRELMVSCGKDAAVLNKAIPGFILNRITLAVFREASYIAENGWATPEDIDKAITATFGPRYTFEGPFALSDFAGIDVYERLGTLLPPVLNSSKECPPSLKALTAEGKLGVKSGEGYYKHNDPVAARRYRDTRILKTIQAIRRIDEEMK